MARSGGDDEGVEERHQEAKDEERDSGTEGEIQQCRATLEPTGSWASHDRVSAPLAPKWTLWYKVDVTELERALSDIAEVRERLAMEQRFKGYSGVAAMLSGVLAVLAGLAQRAIVPAPSGTHQEHLYFAIWFLCAALAAMINYGAILNWFWSDASARDRWQTRTVGLSILPALLRGAGFSFALLVRGEVAALPGVWYGCYGVGLFASRTMLPRGVVPIAAAFLVIGIALLFAPPSIALAWWVLPAGFGIGQAAIGALVRRDRAVAQ